MHVTVVCDPAGHTAVYGPAPTPDPVTPADGCGLTCTAPLHATSAVDRINGRIIDRRRPAGRASRRLTKPQPGGIGWEGAARP